MMDAHQHYWRIGMNDCRWPPATLTRIHRDFEPAELAPLLQRCGISSTMLVQSQDSDRDTDWLLDLASRTDHVAGVVGWVDLQSIDAPARIDQLATHPKLRGLRPMLPSLPDQWLLDTALEPALEVMLDHSLTLDALILPHHLPVIRRFAARHAELSIVIDHGAKPFIAEQRVEPWRSEIAEVAELPNVYCKLSGLISEAAAQWQAEDLQPYVQHLYDCFGAARLMWGSDWPVLNLSGNYLDWWQVAHELLPNIAAYERDAIFGGTARRFYRCGTP